MQITLKRYHVGAESLLFSPDIHCVICVKKKGYKNEMKVIRSRNFMYTQDLDHLPFNKDTLKYCENSVVIQLYNDGINKFKEKYCFRPIVAPRIDKVPLTKEEEEIVSARVKTRNE